MDWFIRRLIVSVAAAAASTCLCLWLMGHLESHEAIVIAVWGEGVVILLEIGTIVLTGLCFIAVSALLAYAVGLPRADRYPDLRDPV